MKSREKKFSRFILVFLRRYFAFFLLMAFIITCCMILFLNTMLKSIDLELSQEHVEQAAKLTFLNIILLSLLCTVIDAIRRKILVDRPVQQITAAAEKLMQGDFSARIAPIPSLERMEGFDLIADYFNKMAEELSGIETLRSDFIANVSHELKTPLAVMQNYVAMLRQPELSEEKRTEYADAIGDTATRLSHLITNILKLNKLENQKIYPACDVYDLSEQLRQCLLAFEEIWEAKELILNVDLEQEVLIDTDAQLLDLVWNNLISNAIKFTEPHGKISLSLKTEEDYAIVRIEDTGCGISSEVGKHIFEKFYQGDASHAASGNGLGLALVKRVIDIVEGDISVSSQVGKGSIFTVRLRRREYEKA